MTKDLPDFQSEIVSAAVEATAFRSGLDADKPVSPAAGDIWWARDTKILYLCAVAGAWTGFDASILVQGILTLYANLAGGGYKLTNIGAPTASTDGARKAEVDAVNAKLDDVTHSEPEAALDTEYQNTTGKIKLVTVSIWLGDTEEANALIDSSSPPSIIVAQVDNTTVGADTVVVSMTFIVPPSWYYMVESTSGAPTLMDWHEWDLH